MNSRRSMDVATVLAAIVVLIVGLTAVAFERGCVDAGYGGNPIATDSTGRSQATVSKIQITVLRLEIPHES